MNWGTGRVRRSVHTGTRNIIGTKYKPFCRLEIPVSRWWARVHSRKEALFGRVGFVSISNNGDLCKYVITCSVRRGLLDEGL